MVGRFRARGANRGPGRMSKVQAEMLASGPSRLGAREGHTVDMAKLEIIGGPTPIPILRAPGDIYRWKVQNGSAEQHVYVQIADSLKPGDFEEPLRSGIESKGESVLRRLLERGDVPVRIKITSGGITEVGVDRRSRPCSL
jgi:hypothetical protein